MAGIKAEADAGFAGKSVCDYSHISKRAAHRVFLVCGVFQKNHRISFGIVERLPYRGDYLLLSFFVPVLFSMMT